MVFTQAQQRQIGEAQEHARELLELFKAWVPKRRATVKQLREIASELRNVSVNVNAGKLAGTTAAVAGGVATVAGIGVTIMTGGLAAPLIGWGIAGSVAGALTSATSDIIGQYVSKEKMDRAQKIMDEEAKLSEEIEQKKAKLDAMVDRLSASLRIDRDQVVGILFLAAFISDLSRLPSRHPHTTTLLIYSSVLGSTLFLFTRVTLMEVGKGLPKVFLNVTLQSVVKVVGAVLKGVALGAAGIVLAWDIYQWVQTTVDLVKGTSAAADALAKIADELEKQMKEIEKWLNDLQCQAKDYDQVINEHFRKLLEKISNEGYATDAQKEEVWQYVQRYADQDWQDTFMEHLDYANFTFHIARVFSILYILIQQYKQKENKKRKHVNITVISHGGIDGFVSIPCSFYYMNDSLKTVTLYEPWGCAVDATVVYGITTNTIQVGYVRYSGQVRPSKPSAWNELPRQDPELTPNVTLTPVKIGEPAYTELMHLFTKLQGRSDGLVIPYFTGPGQDLLPFPTIPFWVFCIALALIASMTNTTISIRLAACLSVADRRSVTGHVPCSQYCTVDGSANPPVMMTSTLGLPHEFRQFIKLNPFL